MSKPITPNLVVAHAQCPRKAFLLLCTEDLGTPHAYERLLEQQQQQNRTDYLKRLNKQDPGVRSDNDRLPPPGQGVLVAATLKAQGLEAYCDVLAPAAQDAAVRHRIFEPTLVVGTHTITQEQRLALAFIGLLLGRLQATRPSAGFVIGMNQRAYRVPLNKVYGRLDPILMDLRAWASATSPAPPPVILNDHCPLCPFRADCASQAEHDDDLSLLDRMPPRVRQRYHDRGIFTVRQLSYGDC